MRTATGFHPDAERWYIRDEGQQFAPGKALPKYHMPGVAESMEMLGIVTELR
jgi:hypothetical protein